MVGPLREVLRVMHGGPFEGSFLRVMHGTDNRIFFSVYAIIYVPINFQGVANALPCLSLWASMYIIKF